ncbi:MAG: ABC transporter ATP-binding protein [Bacteroidales bacterium]|nr:ABC transporter ATP-binding protein [Bacteroidales bacterium]
MQIEVKNIHKTYGRHKVLEDINLLIQDNQIHCLLGKNGVGKTTLINLILELIDFEEGTIIYDKNEGKLNNNLKKRMGVLGENNPLIEELSAYQYLKLCAKLYKVKVSEVEKRISDLSSYFFKEGELNKKLSSFSTGMKKKIGLCAAVIHTPDLLILDEPFSGLDPVAAQITVEFIKAYGSKNRSVFLSSHDLNYVEKIASHITVLDETMVVFSGTFDHFTSEGKTNIDNALLDLLKPDNTKLEKISWI